MSLACDEAAFSAPSYAQHLRTESTNSLRHHLHRRAMVDGSVGAELALTIGAPAPRTLSVL
jgi:hypothetical protein